VRLLRTVELLGLGAPRGAMDEGGLKPLPSEAGAHPVNRRAAHLKGGGDLGVGPDPVGGVPSLVCLQEYAGVGDPARRGTAVGDRALQVERCWALKMTGFALLLGMETPPCTRWRVLTVHKRTHSSYPRKSMVAN
jgi:hypothetical protein